MENRRNFLKQIALAGIALAAGEGAYAARKKPTQKNKGITLPQNPVILFQGDSITNAGRDRSVLSPNNAQHLGLGYALLAGATILNTFASKNPQVYNKGIGGNKVFQLIERWDEDCIALNPDVLSILIGVNDFWHTLNGKFDSTPESYERDYRNLLSLTREKLPQTQLIICEPFAVAGARVVNDSWFPAFHAYRQVAKKLADEFDTLFVPYQSIFDEACKTAPATYWTADGVHPSLAGAELMAQGWLAAVGW